MKWIVFLYFCMSLYAINCEQFKVPTGERLKELRKLMGEYSTRNEDIFAYIVPSTDAHQSEYLAPRDKRREFISGFDGSAGTAVITQSEALMWTDGRYYQQATIQLDENWTLMKLGLPDTLSIGIWLSRNCKGNKLIAVDGNIMTEDAWRSLSAYLDNSECYMKSITPNLIDLVWGDKQPLMPQNSIIPLPIQYSGQSILNKYIEVRKKMKDLNVTALVLTALDEVAYFFNLRGNDIEYNPVFFSYAIITSNEMYLFVNVTKITSVILQHFEDNSVNVIIQNYDDILDTFEKTVNETLGKIWISKDSSYSLTSKVPRLKRIQDTSPVQLMKAVKNKIEAEGFINSHVRDGIALVKYFSWLENEVKNKKTVTELSGAAKLEEFRSKLSLFMGLSFYTINASGPHSSMPHYSPTKESDRNITDTEMYLCDSGGQYLDGTIDTTRTWHFGNPTEFEIEAFTRVLKSQISITTTIFPNKKTSRIIDTLARKSLWDAGLDYGHGTIHGVGHFLNVHEEPMITEMPLQENMFLAIEPGYYEDEKFGVRIENVAQVVPINVGNNFNGQGALTFHVVSLCPIQRNLINVKLLSQDERDHVNAYHKRVYETIAPFLEKPDDMESLQTLKWLRKQTEPI